MRKIDTIQFRGVGTSSQFDELISGFRIEDADERSFDRGRRHHRTLIVNRQRSQFALMRLNGDGAARASGGDGVKVDDVDVAIATSREDDDVAVGEGVGGHGDKALGILFRFIAKKFSGVVRKGKDVFGSPTQRSDALSAVLRLKRWWER